MSRSRFERLRRLGDEPMYCEADPAEILYKGSEDEHYSSVAARKWAYEVAAVNFMNSSLRPLLSASLRGPFEKSSGWTNPWQSETPKDAPKKSSNRPCGPALSILLRNNAEAPSTTCHLPSPVSLDHKVYNAHDYLDEESLARVEDWRSSVNNGHSRCDSFPAPATLSKTNRKRAAKTADWLKTTQHKRRRTLTISHADRMDQLSVITQNNNTSPTAPPAVYQEADEDRMCEDELLVDVEPLATHLQTPSRRSPSRKGVRRSPMRGFPATESDDELSKPSESSQKPRFWRAASARSQINRQGQAASPRSSPSRRFLRTATTTPGADRIPKATEKSNASADFETEQDNSFVFRARKKHAGKARPAEQPALPPLSVRSITNLMSGITSPGREPNPTSARSPHVLVSASPYKLPSASELVHVPRSATPESNIIPTSQPLLDSEISYATKKTSSPEYPANLDFIANDSLPESSPTEESSQPQETPNTNGVSTTLYNNDPQDASATDAVPTVLPTDGLQEPDSCAVDAAKPEDIPGEVLMAPETDGSHQSCRADLIIDEEEEEEEEVQPEPMEVDIVDIVISTDEEATIQDPEISPVHSDQPNTARLGQTLPALQAPEATPSRGEPAVAESQQTPWQAEVMAGPSRNVSALMSADRLEAGTTSFSDTPAFSQPVEPIRNISQQTPWYQDGGFSPIPQLPLSNESSPLRSQESPLAQSPWIRSFNHVRTAAQRTLFAATRNLSFPRQTAHLPNDWLSADAPEESTSVASVDTPSLHTGPSTPRKEGPDTVFEDVSSPHDQQTSASPNATPVSNGFVLKPFSAFRSPSPEPHTLRLSNFGAQCRPTRKIPGILVRRHPSDGSNHAMKLVSWASLEAPSVCHDEDRADGKTGTTPRMRASSPPPDQALAELPTGNKDPFKNHFSAVKMRAKGHCHRILPSASQQVWRSPSPTAMADAFMKADKLVKGLPDTIADANQARQCPVADSPAEEESEESFDDVDEVLRNLGEFLDMVDVEADVEKAKADISAEKTALGRLDGRNGVESLESI